jgi:diketogulonate reductase-like aldo/keto reductase
MKKVWEMPVGEAASSRHELFITTKVWISNYEGKKAADSIDLESAETSDGLYRPAPSAPEFR